MEIFNGLSVNLRLFMERTLGTHHAKRIFHQTPHQRHLPECFYFYSVTEIRHRVEWPSRPFLDRLCYSDKMPNWQPGIDRRERWPYFELMGYQCGQVYVKT